VAEVKWYWHRLRAMTAEEIAFRVRFAIKKQVWRRRKSWRASAPGARKADRWTWPRAERLELPERQTIVLEADNLLAGNYRMLNLTFTEPLIDWHLDPQTGKRAPLVFGPDIDYRDPELCGNVKNIWEKNRHHHLTVLALAWALTRDRRYLAELERQLWSWTADNPFPVGVNWTSSLEAGIRLIAWVWIERLIRGTHEHDRLFGISGKLWPAIYWHQWMIAEHYSHGSSSNNHLIGEMAGLYIAASVWPVFAESARWRRMAKDILEREAVKQTFPGGLNREQAFSYHLFSLEFFLLCGLEGDRAGDPFSEGYIDGVRRMLEVIPLLTDAGGNLPRYGDEDHGMALQLRSSASSRIDWLFRTGIDWIGANVPLPFGDAGSIASALLISGIDERTRVAHASAAAHPAKRRRAAVDDSGNHVLASNRGGPGELFCLFDAAPLGYLSIAGHGHADALSFALSAGGVPVIVDPGTFIYHADPVWRAYFRGTKAHNTITVDGLDQSVAGGPFLWERKARAELLERTLGPDGGRIAAKHDGYTRLKEPVTHKRILALRGNRLTVEDELTGKGEHELDFRLHFAPYCITFLAGAAECIVQWEGGSMRMTLDPRLEWTILRGQADGGWYSPGFNVKKPADTLSGKIRTALPFTFKTELEVNHEH